MFIRRFFQVTMLSETQTDEIVIRDLRLTPMSNPSAARTITHMHYMAWPDFGVPESPKGILRWGFWAFIRKILLSDKLMDALKLF